jgi:hypothetical protein
MLKLSRVGNLFLCLRRLSVPTECSLSAGLEHPFPLDEFLLRYHPPKPSPRSKYQFRLSRICPVSRTQSGSQFEPCFKGNPFSVLRHLTVPQDSSPFKASTPTPSSKLPTTTNSSCHLAQGQPGNCTTSSSKNKPLHSTSPPSTTGTVTLSAASGQKLIAAENTSLTGNDFVSV